MNFEIETFPDEPQAPAPTPATPPPTVQEAQEPAAIDLGNPKSRRMLANTIAAEIDAYADWKYDDGPRSHLGASQIGKPCNRALWYGFRWVHHKRMGGRLQRLFQRGHREESMFIDLLKGIGCEVEEFNPAIPEDAPKPDRQWKISLVDGHFGGSTDGMLYLPARYGNLPMGFLSEFKTQSTGKAFSDLKKNGVEIEKPVHWSQMCTYGYALQIRYAIYMCVNKNDDDLHVEVKELDWQLGRRNEEKAAIIIYSEKPPEKLSTHPGYAECRYCDFAKQCHEDGPYDVNCRSCVNAMPIANKQWFCKQWNAVIPGKEAIKAACPNWVPNK